MTKGKTKGQDRDMATVQSLRAHFDKVIACQKALYKAQDKKSPAAGRLSDKLDRLVRNNETSEAYKTTTERVERAFFDWIVETGIVNDLHSSDSFAACAWPETLQRCADKLSSLMSAEAGIKVCKPLVVVYDSCKQGAIAGSTSSYPGTNKPPKPELIETNRLGSAGEEVTKDFTFLNICHEMAHFFNISLARAYGFENDDGGFDLNEGHPLYGDGMYFREQYRFDTTGWNAYIAGRCGKPYYSQLEERCAYGFAARMEERLRHYREQSRQSAPQSQRDFPRNQPGLDIHPSL